jgi:hypothetical protein
MINFIKSNFLFLTLAMMIVVVSLFFLLNKDPTKAIVGSDITVTNSIGIVSVKYPRELWWRGLEKDDNLPHSSFVKTSRESFARLLFSSGEELLLGPMAFVRISTPDKNGGLKIKVFSGQISFIKTVGKGKKNRVKTSSKSSSILPEENLSQIENSSEIIIETAKIDEPETKEILNLRKEAVSERLVESKNITEEDVVPPPPKVEVVETISKEEVNKIELIQLEEKLVKKEEIKREKEQLVKEEIAKAVSQDLIVEQDAKPQAKIINLLPPMKKITLPESYEIEVE